jgi:hypothetical protein
VAQIRQLLRDASRQVAASCIYHERGVFVTVRDAYKQAMRTEEAALLGVPPQLTATQC